MNNRKTITIPWNFLTGLHDQKDEDDELKNHLSLNELSHRTIKERTGCKIIFH